jgi:predicted small secreted protein
MCTGLLLVLLLLLLLLLLPACNLLQGLGHCEWVHSVSHP